MASLMNKANGRWVLQFAVKARQERQTIALGEVPNDEAKYIKKRVEALVLAIRNDTPPDPSTAKWVAKLDDELHGRLARAGLVTPRIHAETGPALPTLAKFLDEYIAKRNGVKPGTVLFYAQTRRCLVDYFGATRPLDRITQGDAEDWRRWLADDQKLSDNTVRRRCGLAKQFFRGAIRRRLIQENPFGDMAGCVVRENRERDYFVTREEAAKVLEACPDAQWRLLFALSRFGGLRCPSEHLALRLDDINWERSRMAVRSPKTEHHEGKASRLVPIFPELRPYLEEVWHAAPPGTEYLITRYRDRNSNLRTQLERIIHKAGLQPWPKLFANLRATRATELVADGWPEYKVCAWLGHTEAIARKHYWQVTDADFEQAAGVISPEAALQKALQFSGEKRCNPVQSQKHRPAVTRTTASSCTESQRIAPYCKFVQVGSAGFEPATKGL